MQQVHIKSNSIGKVVTYNLINRNPQFFRQKGYFVDSKSYFPP